MINVVTTQEYRLDQTTGDMWTWPELHQDYIEERQKYHNGETSEDFDKVWDKWKGLTPVDVPEGKLGETKAKLKLIYKPIPKNYGTTGTSGIDGTFCGSSGSSGISGYSGTYYKPVKKKKKR